MKRFILELAAVIGIGVVMVLVATGCQSSHKTDAAMNPGVTDVSAPTAANTGYQPVQPAYAAAAQPVAQPVTYDSTVTSASSGSTTAIGGGSYTVKKGDTLYSIARNRYGDGKQWQKIASANPGLRPETLKVGQTITVP